ncbi:MAG: WYL domain-containing protein [Aeromicrobium erythreum]
MTVGSRWYLLAHDLERHDWRSFRLDRMRDPEGTPRRPSARARSRAATPAPTCGRGCRVASGRWSSSWTSRRTVPTSRPAPARGPASWSRSPDRTRVAIESRDPHWAVFGLGHLDADVTLVEAPDEVRATMRRWADRLADASSAGDARG